MRKINYRIPINIYKEKGFKKKKGIKKHNL